MAKRRHVSRSVALRWRLSFRYLADTFTQSDLQRTGVPLIGMSAHQARRTLTLVYDLIFMTWDEIKWWTLWYFYNTSVFLPCSCAAPKTWKFPNSFSTILQSSQTCVGALFSSCTNKYPVWTAWVMFKQQACRQQYDTRCAWDALSVLVYTSYVTRGGEGGSEMH